MFRGLTDRIGFTLVPTRPSVLPQAITELVAEIHARTMEKAGAAKLDPTPLSSMISVLLRNNEIYCYVLTCSFEAKDGSGELSLMAMLEASGRFYRSLYERFVAYDPDLSRIHVRQTRQF